IVDDRTKEELPFDLTAFDFDNENVRPEDEVAYDDEYDVEHGLNEVRKLSGIAEAKLGGVTARKFDEPELTDYMDRILSKSKDKLDKYKRPYIHGGNIIPIVDADSGKKYNLEKLAAAFSERPKKILKQNEKMQHSDGTSSIF